MNRSSLRRLAPLAALTALLARPAAAQDPFAVTPALSGQAFFSCNDVTLNGNVSVSDSVGATTSSAPTNQGHVVSNGNVTLNGSVTVKGNVVAGPGKRITLNGNCTVTGTRTNAATPANCNPIDLVSLANQLRTANDNARIPRTSKGKDPLSGGSRTDFVINGSDTFTFPAGTYYFTSFTVNGNVTVNVAGPVRILCTGAFTLNGGSTVNAGGNPFNFRFWTSGSAFTINGSSTAKGFVYTPSGQATIDGHSQLVGGLFAKAVTLNGGSKVTRALDDAPPTITITEPVEGNPVPNLAAVVVKGRAADDETAVTVTVNGAVVPVAADGSFQTTVDLSHASPAEVVAVATDGAGQTDTKRVRVCLPPPVAALVSPAPGSLVGTRVVTLSGTSGSATSVTVNGIAATLSNGGFTLAGFDLGADGDHVLTIVASTPCGSSTIAPVVSLDTQPPVVAIDTPAPNTYFGSSPITVSGTVSDPHLATVMVGSVTATVSGGRFGAQNVPIPEGSSTLTAVATDTLGHSATSAGVPVVLDTTAPTVSIDTPPNGSVVGTPTITVTGTVSDPNLVRVTVGTVVAVVSGTTFTAANVTLQEGDNVLKAVAVDRTGNSASSQASVVVLDTLPPTVSIDASLPAVTASEKVTVTGTVSDPHLRTVTVGGVDAAVTDGQFTAADVPLAEGDNTLRAHAVDTLGHAADSNAVVVNRDTQAPSVAITSPAPNAQITTSSVTVSGTVSDAHLKDVKVGNVTAVVTNGQFVAEGVPLAEDDIQLVAVATDTVGHSASSAPVPVTVDSQPPAVRIDPPASPVVGTPNVTVTGTATDRHLQSVTVSGVTAVVTGTAFSVSVPLEEGRQELRAVAIDTFGHQTTSDPVVYERDTTAPVVTIDAPAAPCLAGGARVTLSGTYGDVHAAGGATAAVRVEIAPTGGGAPATLDAALDASGRAWSLANVDLGSVDGVATVTAVATDGVGQQARAVRSFRIDGSVPAVALLLDGAPFPGGAPGAAPGAGEQPALLNRALLPRALVTDGAASAPPAPVLTLDGAAYAAGTPITAEGQHLLVAHAVDCAGHDGAAHALFVLDRTAPRLTATTPADGATLGSAVTSFSGTSDPDLASASVNGVPAAVSNGSFTLAPFASKEGANTVRVDVVDRAGNSATFTRSFTVKTLAPTVEILESGSPIRTGSVFFRKATPVVRSNDEHATLRATLNGATFASGTEIAASGEYTLAATAEDSLGHTASASVTFRVDLSPGPTIAITSPEEGAVVAAPAVAVSGTVSAGVVSVKVNGRLAAVTGTTFSAPDVPLEADVSNELVAVATDTAGRGATASRTVLARSGGPNVLIADPVDGFRTNRRKVDVTGAVVGGAAYTANGTVTVAGRSVPLDATGAFRAIDVPLAEGSNTITASAVDAQGRTGTATVTGVADLTSPVVAITADGQALVEGASFPHGLTLRVEVTDNATPPPVPTIRLNGQDRGATSAVTEIHVTESGGYVVSVVVRDAAGNETRAERSFVVDVGGCSLTDVDPRDGASVAAPSVTIHGKSGSASGITVRVPNPGTSPVTYQEFTAQLADGTFAAGDVPLPAVGENALQLVCRDGAGTAQTSTLRVVRLLGGGGPAVRITAPAGGSRTKDAATTVSGTVSDAAARVTVNGQAAAVTPGVNGGTFSLTPAPLVEGPNVLVARAVDATGRAGEDRVVVNRDSAAPRVQITSPQNGASIGAIGSGPTSVDVTGLVELETEPFLDSVVVSSGAGTVTALVDPVTGAFRAPAVPLSAVPGTQAISATATDGLGQSSTSSVQVTLDATGPALRLSEPVDGTRYTEAATSPIVVRGEAWAKEGAQLSVNGGGIDPGTLTWEAPAADGRRHAIFNASISLPASDGAFGVVARVDEAAGKSSSERRLLFKDSVAPTVVEMDPADGAKQVEPNGILLVLFSEPVSRPSLEGANGLVLVRTSTGESVVGAITVAGNAVAFAPGSALARGEGYRFKAGAGITDLAGHPLAQAKESAFTVALSPTDAAPVLDPIPPVVCLTRISVKGASTPGAKIRVRDDELVFTGVADVSGRFDVALPLSGNGFHHLHVSALGRDGVSTSPEATALFRVDCSAPSVTAASFDRAAGRVTVTFSESMRADTLTVGGASGALKVSNAEDAAHTPQAATLTLSPDGITASLDLGSAPDAWWRSKSVRLEVAPPAADVEGNVLSARFETVFFLGGGPGDLVGSFLSGEVYDDESGRPLSNVDARLFASSAALPLSVPDGSVATPVGSTVSDGRGRFSFAGDVVAGRYALVLSRAGFTRVVRRIPLEPSTGAVPFDSRLTQLAPAGASPLVPSAGGLFAGPVGSSLSAEFAPNAVSAAGSLAVQLTPLSGQGLPELLPLGYTPLAAAELRLTSGSSVLPEGTATPFASSGVKLTLPLPSGVDPAASLLAVRYDASSGLWLTLADPEKLAGTGGAPLVRVTLLGPGTVAVVVADTDAAIRPPQIDAGPGAALRGSSLPEGLPALVGTITLDPPVVQPTGRSTARVVARTSDGTTRWPSGLAVQAYLDEKLILSGGGELFEAPFTADLVLYHPPLTPAEQGSALPAAVGAMTFRVSPSPRAAQVLLESGVDNIHLYPFPEQLERGQVLGPAGGSVVSPDGVELVLPEGALARQTVVKAQLLSAQEAASIPVPAGFERIAALRADFAGSLLARPATLKLSIPAGAPADTPADPRLVLARFVDQPSDARGAFSRVVARAYRGGSPEKYVAAPESPSTGLPLDGILQEGVYQLLRATSSIGYATGFVRAENGFGLANARATAQGLGTADVSVPGGQYALAVPAGANRVLEALHPTSAEKGSATLASVDPASIQQKDIVIHPVPPTVVELQPHDGATNQPVGSTIVVRFSEPLDRASVTAGTLRAELADPVTGAATGVGFPGSVALSADGLAVVLSPQRPLSPGRRIVCTFTGGVRDAGGTAYQGAAPLTWSFTTSTQVVFGGQVHPEKFHLQVPVNGVARVYADAGAVPTAPAGTTPWAVWTEVEGPVADPIKNTLPARTDGSIETTVGRPPQFAVTIASKVWVHVLDPGGLEAAAFRLGPFVTADGNGVVAAPREETVFTTAEGVKVTVPAAAFDVPTIVTIKKRDPQSFDVPIPADYQVGAAVDVDFEGEAKETIRLKIPVTTNAAVGTLVFAGSPAQLPWGKKLKMLDLARIVADGSGQKYISNAEEDQPSAPALAARSGINPQTLPRKLIQTILTEFTARATGLFIYSATLELGAMTGDVTIPLLGAQFNILYNFYADTFVYFPLPHDWTGHYILPVEFGKPFRVVQRNLSTGWIVAQQDFAAVTGNGGTLIQVPEFKSGSDAPPDLLDGSPFRFIRFHAPQEDGALSCQALRLEVEACRTDDGKVRVRSTGSDFKLAERSEVSLFNLTKPSGNPSPSIVSANGSFTDLFVAVDDNDELMVVVTPGDLDPNTFGNFTLIFSRPLRPLSDADLRSVVTLKDCGPLPFSGICSNVLVPVDTDQNPDRFVVAPVGSLPRGHEFRFELKSSLLKSEGTSGDVLYPTTSPNVFNFATREAPEDPIGQLPGPSSLGDTDTARDLLKFGNLLLVGSASGKILGIDVSDPSKPKRFALLNNHDTSVRAFASDGHNRLFYNALTASSWGVKAIRIEDVRGATLTACNGPNPWNEYLSCFDPVLGGVRIAFQPGGLSSGGLLGSEYLSLTGSIPTGIPTSMQVLVEDDTDDPKELRAFYEKNALGSPFDTLSPGADGIYTFMVLLNTAGHRLSRPDPCNGEEAWDHYQRVSIDNLTTGQTWSFDVRNPWSFPDATPDTSAGSGDGRRVVQGIRARRGDQLRIRYNLRAYGYVAITGSGISVVDLNRFYRTHLVAGVGTGGLNNLAQCGRRLGKFEGQDLTIPPCSGPGGTSVPTNGIPYTPDLAVAVIPGPKPLNPADPPSPGRVDVFSALTHVGGIHTWGFDDKPGDLQAVGEGCFAMMGDGKRVSIRSVVLAEKVSWLDRHIRGDLVTGKFTAAPGSDPPELREQRDLLFYSLGDGGVLVFDVTERGMGDPIGVFRKKGHTAYRLQVDARTGRLFAGGNDELGKAIIDVWDIARANGSPEQSGGSSIPVLGGDDSRLLLSVIAPWTANHVAIDDSGTGLLFTWGGGEGGLAIPIETPHFVFAGLYLPTDEEGGADASTPRPVPKLAKILQPLGVPTRVKVQDEVQPALRKESERKATAAFKVRVALPGKLGDTALDVNEFSVKVQTLRVRPDELLLAKENLGRAVALPGGSAWPDRDVYVTMRRIGTADTTGATGGLDAYGETGRLAAGYNLYESKEVVLLLADPRARKEYRNPGGSGSSSGSTDPSSEWLQCRRCDRPDYLKSFDAGDVKELLAGGPYVRALISVDPKGTSGGLSAKTQQLLDYFNTSPVKDVYRLPIGTVPVAAWADEVPSPVQASLAEPIQNAATFAPGEAGVNVSLAAGDVKLHTTDHSAAGRSLSLHFDRSYRSGLAGYGPLGAAGWTSNYLAHLRVIPAMKELGYLGEVEYHDGRGDVFRFYPPNPDPTASSKCPVGTEEDSGGSFCVPNGLYAHLQQLEAGKGFRLIDRQHGTLAFDESGRLVDGSDRHRRGAEDPDEKGNTLQFGYDGFGFLVHLEDDMGRPYKLDYKSDPIADDKEYGLLTRVSDFEGREIKYKWDDAKERLLKSVSLPDARNRFWPEFDVVDAEVGYAYADPGVANTAPLHEKFSKLKLESFTLAKATAPRVSFKFEGGSSRLSEIHFPLGVTWNLGYEGNADAAATGATVRSPWGTPTKYVFEKGRVVSKIEVKEVVPPEGLGTVLNSAVTTTLSYMEDGRNKSVTWPDGSKTNYCYGDGGGGSNCPAASTAPDLLSRANLLKTTRARGTALKGTAQHEDEIEQGISFNEDNLPSGGTDGRGRAIQQAVPMAEANDTTFGYTGEGVGGKSSFDNRGRVTSYTSGLDTTSPGPGGVDLGKKVSISFIYENNKSNHNYGRLIQMFRGYDDPNDGSQKVGESYDYDKAGNLIEKVTTYGARTLMAYDAWDRQIQTIEGLTVLPPGTPNVDPEVTLPGVKGVETHRAYDYAGHLVRERRLQNPLGWVETRYVYNDREQLVDVYQTQIAKDTLNDGVIADPVLVQHNEYAYGTGLLANTVSAEGTVTNYYYDVAGRITASQLGSNIPGLVASSIKRRGYDVMDRIALTSDDANNVKWRGVYDAWGRRFKEILPTGAVLETEYDKASALLRETTYDKDGPGATKLTERRVKVNAFGSPTEIRELLKSPIAGQPEEIRLTKRTYDTNGRLAYEESGKDGGTLRPDLKIEYQNGSGRVAKKTDAVGNETIFEYKQAANWPTKVTRKETVPGSTSLIETSWTKSFRDALGQVLTETHRNGDAIDSTYDQAGNVLMTTTKTGVTTFASYDGLGRLLTFDRPAGRGRTLNAYDKDGRLLRHRNVAASGLSPNDTIYEYDNLTGRLKKITHPDGTFERLDYNLDDTLDVIRMRSGIEVKHQYDSANRLIARFPQVPAGGGAATNLLLDGGDSFSYDALSRPTKIQRMGLGVGSTTPDPSATIAFENYDSGSRPERELVGEGAAARPPLVRSYDVFDRPVGVTLPAGVGHDATSGAVGYGRVFDDLDRPTNLCDDPTIPSSGILCAGSTSPVGATWAWGGTGRIYGITNKGPLKTAHRFGYVNGPGVPPPTTPPGSDFRLGTLSVGSTLQDPIDASTSPLDRNWARFAYGYRDGDGAKLGRAVVGLGGSSVGGDPNTLSLFSSQGWAWGIDAGMRLTEAQAGAGNVLGADPTLKKLESFHFGYGEGDEIQKAWREVTGELVTLTPGPTGRVAKRNGIDFHYDLEGRRLEDDRFLYTWNWRGELARVTVKDTAPGPAAGLQVRYGYDAAGRLLTRTTLGKLPQGSTDDSTRPFVEKREYLWDGDSLLSEVARSENGALRWRKSYVPGATGLDDAVQAKIEKYDPTTGALTGTTLYSYLRDEQGTVTGVVEERQGADPAKPPVVARYLYDPYGAAHVETAPEVYSVAFDNAVTSVTPPSGSPVNQSATAGAAPGSLRIVFSTPIDTGTFSGLVLERRLTDGTWGALTAAELAIGRDSQRTEELILLPVAGLARGTSYRARLTSALKDTGGRAVAGSPLIEFVVPAAGDVSYQETFNLQYDSALAAGNDLAGRFPGGQTTLFQGLYTDPITGMAFARARWFDSRNVAFLQEDPEGDVDSPNTYAFVGLRPNEFTDPMGLDLGLSDYLGIAVDTVAGTAKDTWEVGKKVLENKRVQGALQALGGLAEVDAGAAALLAPEPTGLTKVVGVVAVAHGLDNVVTGLKQLWTGEQQETLTKKGVQKGLEVAGVEHDTADKIATGVDIALGFVAPVAAERAAVNAELRAGQKALRVEAAEARAGEEVLANESKASKVARVEEEASSAERTLARGCSLLQGTPVLVADGYKGIEDLAPGDKVWAFNEKTGEVDTQPILWTYLKLADRLLVLNTEDGQAIDTTDDHPFFVVGEGWRDGRDLRIGDRLRSFDGTPRRISAIEHRDGSFPVFNFSVAGDHTYFASGESVLVHNVDNCNIVERLAGGKAGRQSAFASLERKQTAIYEVFDPKTERAVYVGKTFQEGGTAEGVATRFAQHLEKRPEWIKAGFDVRKIAGGSWTEFEAATHEMAAITQRGGLAKLENAQRAITPRKFELFRHLHTNFNPNPF